MNHEEIDELIIKLKLDEESIKVDDIFYCYRKAESFEATELQMLASSDSETIDVINQVDNLIYKQCTNVYAVTKYNEHTALYYGLCNKNYKICAEILKIYDRDLSVIMKYKRNIGLVAFADQIAKMLEFGSDIDIGIDRCDIVLLKRDNIRIPEVKFLHHKPNCISDECIKLRIELVQNGWVNIDHCTVEMGDTHFHIAAFQGQLNIVKTLIKLKSNPETLNHDGQTPFYYAIKMNQNDVFENLINKMENLLNYHDKSGLNYLMVAALNGNYYAFTSILSKIANHKRKLKYLKNGRDATKFGNTIVHHSLITDSARNRLFFLQLLKHVNFSLLFLKNSQNHNCFTYLTKNKNSNLNFLKNHFEKYLINSKNAYQFNNYFYKINKRKLFELIKSGVNETKLIYLLQINKQMFISANEYSTLIKLHKIKILKFLLSQNKLKLLNKRKLLLKLLKLSIKNLNLRLIKFLLRYFIKFQFDLNKLLRNVNYFYDFKIFKKLLHLNNNFKNCRNIINIAVKSENFDLMNYLLKRFDIKFKFNLIFEIIPKANSEMFQLFVEKFRNKHFEIKDRLGNTALHLACLQWNYEIFKEIVKHNVDVNATNNDGNTALHLATQTEMARKLLQMGSDPNALNHNNETPLFTSLRNYNTDIALLYFERDDINYCHITNSNQTILHLMANFIQMCINPLEHVLKQAKFDLMFQNCLFEDKFHRVPLDDAIHLKNFIANEILSRCNDDYHETSIKILLKCNQISLLKPFEHKIKDNCVLLRYAIRNNSHQKTIEYLLHLIPNINECDEKHRTCLHLAVLRGECNLIEIILNRKPNLLIQDNSGKCAFDYASAEVLSMFQNILSKTQT